MKPRRSFRVVIRVPVDRFDDCVSDLRDAGELQRFVVTKEDKSEEVRQKFAERDSLRAHVESLTALRSSEGKVSELADLESRIQEVQKQIRGLDVALGEFVKKESYNNINYSLTERITFFVDDRDSPISARIVASLLWTFTWYTRAVCLLAMVVLTGLSLRVLRQG